MGPKAWQRTEILPCFKRRAEDKDLRFWFTYDLLTAAKFIITLILDLKAGFLLNGLKPERFIGVGACLQ